MYKFWNPNPKRRAANDCVVRMLAKVFDLDWYAAYDILWEEGRKFCEIPTTNYIWEGLLKDAGFRKREIICARDCLDIASFCDIYRSGVYIIGTGTHVVTCKDGDYYDAWDSGNEVVIYYFERSDNN